MQTNNQTIIVGGGCFWCVEAVLIRLNGVLSVVPGYAGGTVAEPSYEQVCAGKTGHAEVAKVEFDPDIIPLRDVLDIFFHTHDPTTLNAQGADVGPQYRSVIYYTNEEQRIVAIDLIEDLNSTGEFRSKIVTELKPLDVFYEAEEHHRQYYKKNSYQPYCQVVISPKIAHLKEKYTKKLKPEAIISD